MSLINQRPARIRLTLFTLGLLICGVAIWPATADDTAVNASGSQYSNWYRMRPCKPRAGKGCYQGFGLNWHLGYGYGGKAVGVGQDGGYPAYGGVGYPGPMPEMRRFHKECPYYYNGNPGGPSIGCPHYYGVPGGMIEDQPVITFEPSPFDRGYVGNYGIFSGAIPYPESAFVPKSDLSPITTPSPASSEPASADETPAVEKN